MSGNILSSFIADDVRFEANGKMMVIGLYQDVTLDAPKPTDTEHAKLYILITDLPEGDHKVDLHLHDHTGEQSIRSNIGLVKDTNPSNLHQMIVELEQFEFPSSGSYSYDILVNGDKIYTNHLMVRYLDQGHGAEE